jgi:hypothetical protein
MHRSPSAHSAWLSRAKRIPDGVMRGPCRLQKTSRRGPRVAFVRRVHGTGQVRRGFVQEPHIMWTHGPLVDWCRCLRAMYSR